jgi:hypothetical protein
LQQLPVRSMDDKESILKKVEDGIKGAAKAVENFADEVAAPQAPVVLIPDEDTATTKINPAGSKDGS